MELFGGYHMISVHLGLSYKCNMNCNHCYVKEKEKTGNSFHPDQFDYLLLKLKQLGAFSITYTMGEVLLYPHFLQFAGKAHELSFYQILLSNGSLLQTSEDIKQLVDVGIKRVGISIDNSCENIHDKNRSYVGAYKKALRAISLLSAYPGIDVQILSTISNENLRDVDHILQLGSDMNVKNFSFLWIRKDGMIVPVTDYDLYSKTMQRLIEAHAKRQYHIHIHDYRVNQILEEMYQNGSINNEIYRELLSMNHCHSSEEMVLITPSGDMFSCNFAQKPFANIFTDDLETIKRTAIIYKASCTDAKK